MHGDRAWFSVTYRTHERERILTTVIHIRGHVSALGYHRYTIATFPANVRRSHDDRMHALNAYYDIL